MNPDGKIRAAYTAKGANNRLSRTGCGKTFEPTCPTCGTAVGKRLNVLADFLIGAHALTHADCIISRDLGVHKTYFSDFKAATST
jgi:hypothetical protein